MTATLQDQLTNLVLSDSNGTAMPVGPPELGEDKVLITTFRAVNTGGPTISLDYNIRPVGRVSEAPHPEVLASLQRSIEAHIDVWEELSSY